MGGPASPRWRQVARATCAPHGAGTCGPGGGVALGAPGRSGLPATPGAKWGVATPHLGLLRGVGEGQRVDAAGGQARLERFGAVSENDLLALGREGVLSCLKKRRRALRRGPEREPRLLRGAALRRARRVGSLAVRRAGRRRFALHGKLRSPPILTLGDGSREARTSFCLSPTTRNAGTAQPARMNFRLNNLPSRIRQSYCRKVKK